MKSNKLFNTKTIVYLFLLAIIICFSFRLYSSNYYHDLNSDDALNILIAHNYSLPECIYCWGQDRGGTFVALIAQVFLKIFDCRAVTAISLSNYLIILTGFFCLSSFLKTYFAKICLALALFLPLHTFADLLRFPLGVEYSLVAIAIFLIRETALDYEKRQAKNYTWQNHLMICFSILILTISVWVSDLTLVNICVLLFVMFFHFYRKMIQNTSTKINFSSLSKFITQNKTPIIYICCGLFFCATSILITKHFASAKVDSYVSINTFAQVREGLYILLNRFYDLAIFNTINNIRSIYFYVFLFVFILLIISLFKYKVHYKLINTPVFLFFFLDFFAVLSIFMISTWVLLNNMGQWYFCASYVSLLLITLLGVEALPHNKLLTKTVKVVLIVNIIIGVCSPFYSFKHIHTQPFKPMIEVIGEIGVLGDIGIIADYWNSYIVASANPDSITATPHDKNGIRNPNMTIEVFKHKNIYIIRDGWLENFPDTLIQFDRKLIRCDSSFILGGRNICRYELLRCTVLK